jgi:hypothetical protein
MVNPLSHPLARDHMEPVKIQETEAFVAPTADELPLHQLPPLAQPQNLKEMGPFAVFFPILIKCDEVKTKMQAASTIASFLKEVLHVRTQKADQKSADNP